MMNQKTLLFLVVLLAGATFLAGTFYTKVQYLEKEKSGKSQATPTPQTVRPTPPALATTIGNFSITKEEVCSENGKPIIYFFGSQSCPHCRWEHPIFEGVVKKFGDKISFHNNMDKPDADKEIWNKYASLNQGGIPFIVLGCQYARVGSGEQLGEKEEEKNLTALICKLTVGQPEKVCQTLSDLINQIP